MISFTLDPHCPIALRDHRPEAPAIQGLVAAHQTGTAQIALPALSQFDDQIHDFKQFRITLQSLGLGEIPLLRPMTYFDMAFPECCIFPTEELEDIEREIHSILYPSIHYAWRDFRKANQIEELVPSMQSPWRQAKCDVQAILAHIENERDVFVTSADIFHRDLKKRQLIALGARAIETPGDAVAMIE